MEEDVLIIAAIKSALIKININRKHLRYKQFCIFHLPQGDIYDAVVQRLKLIETGSGGEVIPIVVNFKVFSTIIRTATAQRNDCFTQANRPTNV